MVSHNTWKVSNIFFKPSDAFRAPEGLKGSGMFTNTTLILFPLRSEYSFHLGHYLINTLSIPSLGLITPHSRLELQKPGYWVSLPHDSRHSWGHWCSCWRDFRKPVASSVSWTSVTGAVYSMTTHRMLSDTHCTYLPKISWLFFYFIHSIQNPIL